MRIDADPRSPLGSFAGRLLGVLALAALTGSPTMGQINSPRFQTRAPLAVSIGDEPGKHAFVLADVNDDRVLDIIAIEPDESRVDVFINQGNGTYDLVSTPGAGDITPTAVAVADVGSTFASNEAGAPDGKPDIIVGGDAGEVAIIFGRNDGQFDSPSPDDVIEPDATLNIVGVVADDFDDGNGTDIALLDDDGVVLLCNDGSGQFADCTGDEPLPVGEGFPTKIVRGDFNGDARSDVAVLVPEDQTVAILLGNDDGTFREPTSVNVRAQAEAGEEAVDMTVARVDGDNLDDIVAVNSSTALAERFGAVILGSTGRFVQNNIFVVDFDATTITAADFDNGSDRASDVIIGYEDGPPTFASGLGNGEFNDNIFTPGGAGQVAPSSMLATADVGGDTLPDFVALNLDGSQIRVAVNISNEPTPTPGTPTPDDRTPTFTPTGPPPATSTVTGTPTASNTPSPTNTPTPIPTANFGRCDAEVGGTNLAAIAAGDLDGDALPDLAASDAGAGAVRIIFSGAAVSQVKACAAAMSSMGIASESVSLGGRTPGPIAIGDFDRDGVNEIAVGAGDRVLFLDRGDGTTFAVTDEVVVGGTVRAITASYPNQASRPESRALLDLNNDMRGDLIIANGTTTLTILYGAVGELPGQSVTQATSCGATALDAGDFNGDGRIDIAVGCGSRATWLQQQAATGETPTFQPKSEFASGGAIVGVAAGYLDSNGNADLLLTRGGSSPGGESYLFSNGTFVLASSGRFSAGADPIAGGLGAFNPIRRRFDAVIGSKTNSELQFAYSDVNGGFPGPVVIPFDVRQSPNGLVVVDFDNDSLQDVALANSDGTVTILVSSVPPPTPTPTVTPTASQTPTATTTQTPSATPTDTPTSTPSPTGNATSTATAARTNTPGPSPTPTNTRGGIVLGSCAIADGGSASPLQVGLIALLLAGARWVTMRRARVARMPHGR